MSSRQKARHQEYVTARADRDGGLYRLNPKEQIDIHVAFGRNHNSPPDVIGVGCSARIDGLFGNRPTRQASRQF